MLAHKMVMKKLAVVIVVFVLAYSQNCQGNQIIFGDTCLDSCPQNTVTVNRDGLWGCEECDITKLLILSQDKTRCQCSIQSYQIYGYQQCAPCHYSCLTCSGPSSNQCLTCQSYTVQTFRQKNGNKCPCKYGYLDVTGLQTLVCTKCHQDCLSCSGPQETDCLECANGRRKNEFQLCVCVNSFVQDDSGVCTCPSPLAIMPDGICRNPSNGCGLNQQRPVTSSKSKNVASAAISSTGCVCKAGFAKIKGQCSTCPTNFVFNSKKGKCQCDPRGFKFKKECIICPSDQVFDKRTGQCSCKKNFFKTELDTCVSCPVKMIYSGGSCKCAINFYLANNNKCRKCTKKTDNPSCQEASHDTDKPRKLDLTEIKIKKKRV